MACLTHDIGQHAGSNRTAKVRNQVVQILSICDQRQSRHTSHTHRIEGNVEQTDQHTADACTVGLSSAAALWQSVVIFVPAMLKNVMFSYLSSSDNHSSLINKLLLVNFLSSLLPVSIVILFSGFISSFYGVSFVGLPKVLNISAAAALFICLSEVYCYEFISRGKPWIVFIARLVRDMFILILTYIILQQINESQAYWFALISLIANGIFLILLHLRYRYVK